MFVSHARKAIVRSLAAVVVTVALCGSASAENYAMARLRDLKDIIQLEFGLGRYVAEIDLRATDYFTFCVGAAESRRFLVLGKWRPLPTAVDNPRHNIISYGPFDSRWESNVGFPFSLFAGWDNENIPPTCTWLSMPEFADLGQEDCYYAKNWLFVDDYRHQKPWAEKLDVEVGLTIPFVAFRVGFSAGDFVDFFAGLAGFDPAEDDLR